VTTITALAERQLEWSARNFPDRRPDHAIMGLIEETAELVEAFDWSDSPLEYILLAGMMRYLGRLAHIHLKREQGIRKASTTDARQKDAVAKLMASLFEYQAHEGMIMVDPDVVLEDFIPDEAKERDSVGDVFVYWLDFNNRRKFDAEEVATETLDQVTRRDWVRDPALGGQQQLEAAS
jgi:hypothetical protein